MKEIFKVYRLFVIVLIFTLLIPVYSAKGGWEHFDSNNISNLPSSHINTLAMDPNRLWIGTDNGLIEYNLLLDDPNIGWTIHAKVDPNYIPVSSMDIDQNMVLWLGTSKGLVSYDPYDPNNLIIHDGLYFDPNDSENIRDIEVDTNFIWISTGMGLNRFDRNSDPNSDPFTLYANDPNGFDASSAEAVVSKEEDIVWVLPQPIIYIGVYRYSVSNDQWDFFSPYEQPTLTALIMGDSNDIWFGSLFSGLWRFETDHPDPNDAWTKWEDANFGLPSNIIWAIDMYRGSNKIIMATANGIARYDSDQESWQSIFIPPSLDLDSQFVTDILVDPDYHQVWFGTESGGLYRWKEEAIITPEVVDTDPDPNDIDINPYAPIQIWFNKLMDQNSFFSPYMITFQAEGDILPASINEEEMDFPDPNHLIISISGDPPLEPGRKYTFTVNENVTDILGNPLSESFELQFTVKTAPQILYLPQQSPYPADSSTDVSLDTNIAVEFSSPMDKNSVETGFSLDPTVTGEFYWYNSDTKVVFQPDNPLASGIRYDVTIDTNARDRDGIPLEIPFTWYFTTDSTPVILSSFPQDNEDSVSIYANIEIKFSSPMNESSVEGVFSLLDDQNTPVSGGFSWDPNSTELKFIPSDPLDPNHNYKASINTSAQSQSGTPLAQGKTWQFTTVSLETISPPVGGWPVFDMGMDPNSISVTAMALNSTDGGIWAGLASLDPNSQWMGIGLFHYDGNNWKQYTSFDPNCGLTSDSINDLAFDSQGNLWIATEPDPGGAGGGVNMFDGRIWQWYDPNTFNGLSKDDNLLYVDFLYVNAIDVYFTGTEDLIWIATTGGIAVGRYSSNSNDWEWSATTEFPFTSLIAVDHLGGTVWVASDLFMNDPNEPCNSIAGFDAEKLSQWQSDIWDPNFRVWSQDGGLPRTKSPEERISSYFRAMTVDGFGNIWLGTKDRLYKINIDDLLLGECNFESCDYIETKGGLLPDSIYDIIVNPVDPNELWVATDSGISVLKITEPIKSPDSWTRYPITDAMVLTILPGSTGGVYAGTDKGLLIIGDIILPTTWIHSSYPVQGEQSVSIDLEIRINFNREMDRVTSKDAFCLRKDPNNYGENYENNPCVEGTFEWFNGNRALKFIPNEDLTQEIVYFLTIDETARDIYGNSLPIPFNVKFKTELYIPPVFFLPEPPVIFPQDPERETNRKFNTRISSDGQRYLCVWQEQHYVTDDDILGQMVSSDGTFLGDIIKISESIGDQDNPDLDSDGNNFMVVWYDRGNPNITGPGIYGALISADGTILKGEIPIAAGSGDLRFPKVKWNGVNYLVVWEDWKDHDFPDFRVSVYGKRIDQTGNLIDQEPLEISADSAFNEKGIRAGFDLASLGDPNMPSWLMVWNGSSQDPLKIGFDIMGRFLYEDPNGELYFDKDPFQIPIPYIDQYYPSIEALGNEFLVVWEEDREDEEGNTNKNIGGIKLNSHGEVLGNTIDISSATNDQTLPEVAANGQAYFVIWLDQRDSQPGKVVKHVYGTRVSSEGSVLKDDPDPNVPGGTRISTDPNQTPWYPATASTGPGDYRYFCFWSVQEETGQDIDWSLIGRIYDPPPAPELRWVGPPDYDGDGVDPDSDSGGSPFTFKVEYFSHEDINAGPEIAQIWIDLDDNGSPDENEVFPMTGESYSEYKNGRIYSYSSPSILYDGDGELIYRFFFTDKYNMASGDPAKVNTFQVNLSGSKPILDWTNEPDFTGDGVRPDDIEWGTDTSFEFRVIYQDEDGDQPQHMELWVDANGDFKFDPNEKLEMDADGSSYQQGQIYTKTVELDFYSTYWIRPVIYKFESDDGNSKATGEPRVLSYFTINPLGETSACLNIHNQLFPTITSTGSGYQVFWQDDREKALDANDVLIVTNHIWMELLSEDGRVKDDPNEPGQIRIDTGSKGAFKPLAQFDPETQKTLVIWEDLRNGSTREPSASDENLFKPEVIYEGLDIYGTFIDAEGNPLTDTNDSNPEGEFIIGGSADSRNMLNPDMALGANGQYIIIWESDRRIEHSERTEIWAKFVRYPDGVGERIWIDIAVEGRDFLGDGHQLMPRVAWNGEYYLAVWQDIDSVDPITGYDLSRVYGIRIDPNGELHPPTSVDQVGQLLPDTEYAYKFFNDSELQALEDPNVNQLFPDVASDGENFLIVWQDSRALGTEGGYDIYGMRVNVDGMAIDYLDKPFREIPICTADGHQIRPRVFWDPQAGQYIIMWVEIPYNIPPGYMLPHRASFLSQRIGGEIKVARMDPNGQLMDGPPSKEDEKEVEKHEYKGTSLVGVSFTQDLPDMACDPSLGCRLIWEDVRNTFSYDLYTTSFQSTLNWIEDPNFLNGIHPSIATTGSTFTFKVEYRDRMDNLPETSQVWIDLNDDGIYDEEDERFNMEISDPNKPDSEGWIYTFNKKIDFPEGTDSDGVISYRFYFETDEGLAKGVGSGPYTLSVTPVSELDWTGETGFETDGVKPDQADSGTEFVFSVSYSHPLDLAPAVSQVLIDLNDDGGYTIFEHFDMEEDDPEDTDLSDGKVYKFSCPVSYHGDGIIEYRFFFHNGVDEAIGEPASDGHTFRIIQTVSDVVWQTFTINDGLAGNYVTSLAIDQNNSVWAGFLSDPNKKDSGGVSRFNGNQWKTFRGTEYLPHNSVTSLTISSDNHLWMSTVSGISHFDGQAWEKFTDIEDNDSFRVIVADDEGRIWAGAFPKIDQNANKIVGGGLAKYDSGTWTFYSSEIMGGNFITALETDANGIVWVGIGDITDPNSSLTDPNIAGIVAEYKGIFLFNPDKGSFEENTLLQDYPGGDLIITIYRDESDDMWVGSIETSEEGISIGRGLSRYSYDQGTWTHYETGRGGVEFGSNFITSVFRNDEDLWLGHHPEITSELFRAGGATRHNLTDKSWRVFDGFNTPVDSLAFNFINDLVVDAEGNVWFGTVYGLFIFYPTDTILSFAKTNFVNGVYSTTGVAGDEFEFQVRYWQENDEEPDVAQVWIDLNDDGKYDAGAEKFDMDILDPNNNDYFHGKDYNLSIPIDSMGDGTLSYRFYFEKEGSAVLGIPAADHALNINPEPPPELMWQSFHDGKYVSSLAVDENNMLWVGFRLLRDPETGEIIDSDSGGIARLDGDEWTYFRQSEDVLSLQITPTDNHLWAWTSAGLLEYDGINWETYTDVDPNINFFGMAADNQGRVWVVKSSIDLESGTPTDPNIYSVDPNALQISSRLIRYESGLDPIPYTNVIPEGDLLSALTTDVNGQVWIGINDIVQDPNGRPEYELKMILFDPKTANTEPLENEYPGYSAGGYIMGLDRDDTGDIWVVSYDISKANPPVVLTHFNHENNTWNDYFNGEGGVRFGSNNISAIDRRGNDLWLGHRRQSESLIGGATYHNLSGTSWKLFNNDSIEDVTVTEDFNNITALVIDHNGIAWFGTSDGLYRYEQTSIIPCGTFLAFTDQDFYKGVFPDTGMSGYSFEFRVQYSDENNEPPDMAQAWIDFNDDGRYDNYEKFEMSPLEPDDQNYKDGVIFSYIKSIGYAGDGSVSYRFYFEKEDSLVSGTPALDHNLYIKEIPYDDSGSLDIIDSNGILGHYVFIPIQIQNAPNSVHSFSFEITYDPYILEYSGYLSGERIKQFDYFDVYQPEDPGMLKIGGFELGEHIIQSGSDCIIAFLEFRIIGCEGSNHTSKLAIGNLEDDFLNWSYSGGNFICIIDNEPPVPDIDPLPAIIKDCGVGLVISQFPTATDEFAGVIIAETNETLNYNEQGAYTITWAYDDGFGNITSQEQQIVIFDDEDPNIHEVEGIPKGKIESGENVTLKVKATDNCEGDMVYKWLKGDKIIGEESTITYKFGKGEHKVVVMVTDKAGNTSVSDTIIIKVKGKESSSVSGYQGSNLFGGINGLFPTGGLLYSSLLPNYNYSYTSSFSRYPAIMTSFMMPYTHIYSFSNYDYNYYSHGYRFPFIIYNEWKGYPDSIPSYNPYTYYNTYKYPGYFPLSTGYSLPQANQSYQFGYRNQLTTYPLNFSQYGTNIPHGIQYEYNRWFPQGDYGRFKYPYY